MAKSTLAVTPAAADSFREATLGTAEETAVADELVAPDAGTVELEAALAPAFM